MAQSDLHSAWARLFVSSLVSAKVVDVVCSPGLALDSAGTGRGAGVAADLACPYR